MEKNYSNVSLLVVGPSSNGLKGGQATHMENIANAFLNEEKLNLNSFYSSSGMENTEGKITKLMRLITTVFSFPFKLKNTSVVHINSSFDTKAIIRDFLLLLPCIYMKKKLILQYHGGNPYKVSLFQKAFIRNAYLKIWKQSKILILNDDQKEWFDAYKISNVTKIKNYVPLPSLDIKSGPIDNDFIYIGRIIKEKGLFEIINAAKTLDQEGQLFRVSLYGNGEDFSIINEYIKTCNLQHRVFLKGSIDVEEKENVLSQADFFLYPSFYPEGLPYAVLEALSYALPVICTDAGALKDVVIDQETCLKVQEKSAEHLAIQMKSLLEPSGLKEKISQNSRALIEKKYSVEVMKKVFLGFWEGENTTK